MNVCGECVPVGTRECECVFVLQGESVSRGFVAEIMICCFSTEMDVCVLVCEGRVCYYFM